MTLTKRDRMLLGDLQQYGLLSTKHLSAKHFPGVLPTTVSRRLRMLEAANYIQRIPSLEESGSAWGLAKAGAKEVEPAPAKIHFPRFIQEHDLKLAALRLRLEEVGLAQAWRPEHEIRARVLVRCGREGLKDQTIPDGIMAMEADGYREAVAVELELTQKNQDRYHRIFHDYHSKENLWGFWYVVGHASIGNQLMTAASAFRRSDAPSKFHWSLLNEVMKDPLDAVVQNHHGSFRMHEIWKPNVPTAAQSPAQPVGTQGQEEEVPVLALSSQNETKNTEATQG